MIYLILIFALILRLPLLNGSFWLDEAAQFLESARPLSQQLNISEDFQPPLMHLLTFISIRLGTLFNLNTTEWWLRLLPSLLPGIISIFALYQLGLKLSNRRTALLASFLLSTASFHIFYSQELRPYSLPTLWAMLASWQLLELIKNQKKLAIYWFGLFSILGLYSSYLYPFLLFGQLAYMLQQKVKLKQIIILISVLAFSFLPWLPKFLEQLQTGQALRSSMPGWDQVVSLPQFKTALLVPLKFVFGVSDLQLNLSYLILAAAIFGPLIYLSLIAWRKKSAFMTFFFYLFMLPLLLAWLISFFIPVLQAKRVLFLLPLFSLLEAWLIINQAKKAAHLSKILLVAILVINFFSTYAYWTQSKLQRENWRALSREISQKFPKEQTAVVFAFDQPFATWRFYDQTGFKTFSSGGFDTKQLENLDETFEDLTNYRYVLLFDYLRDLTDANNLLEQTILDLGFKASGVLDYPSIGFVRIYHQEQLALQ